MATPVTAREDLVDAQINAQLAILAEELRRYRKRRDLSIEQLASLSGVSRSMISKVERCEAVHLRPFFLGSPKHWALHFHALCRPRSIAKSS